MSTRDDFTDEIRAHLQIETDRLIADGMTPEAARLAARRAFGNVTRAEERFYESQRWMWLDRLRLDVRGAARSVARYPIAAAVAVLSLALGIGATTATLTIRSVVFYKPPPLYRQPAQISRVQVGRPDRPIGPGGNFVPGALFAAWHDARGPAVAGATPPRGVRDVRTMDRTDALPVRAFTPGFFALLGVAPAVGHADGAVLSYRVWQTLFDLRPDVAGQIVWIDNRPYTVSGALPQRFWFSEMNAPIWIPLDRQTLVREEALEVVVRRPADVTPERLANELEPALRAYAAGLPASERQLRVTVSGIEGTPIGRQVSIVLPYVLGASVLLTLLIAIANVAILMIAQWTAREHEIAIRASLGAGRWRIVRALLTESILIATGGGVLGVCATFALLTIQRSRTAVEFFDLSVDARILIQSAVVTLAAGVLAGIAPALYETRRLHVNPLRAIASSDRVRQRWRHALVVLEITVTIALLVETSAMIAGYQRARAAELGFRTRPLLTARVENAAGVQVSAVLGVLRRVPGVVSVAASTTVPYAAFGSAERVAVDAIGSASIPAERGAITPEFFATLDVPLRSGRAFTSQDSDPTRTVIVNETLSRALFPGRDPIGAQVWIGQTSYDIVGVVADYSNNPFQPHQYDAKVYVPIAAASRALKRVQFLVRAAGDPAPLVQTVRRDIRDASAGTAATSVFTFDQIRDVMGQEMLVGTAPLFPLIAIGMLLTAAGIYGVLAFAMTRRSRELAVRVAIGATGRDVVRLVAGHSLRLVATGIVLGIGAMLALTTIIRATGGAGTVFDAGWRAFAIPLLIVLAIAALATWIPSRRATSINPALLLRTT